MTANIGEMFYTGTMPWHGLGRKLERPITVTEALTAAGLNWRVGEVDLVTQEISASPVKKRKAIVRLDRMRGDSRRVLGVSHRGFAPIQNEDGARLFGAIFGQGTDVYHTGGYLGSGEIVWLLAKINRPFEIGHGDIVEPYALFSNSHDGSRAFSISLTTVRVVCRNTLSQALRETRFGKQFRRGHQSSLVEHTEAARHFFAATLKQLDDLKDAYVGLTKRQCPRDRFDEILIELLPDPVQPRNVAQNKGLMKAFENRLEQAKSGRKVMQELRDSGIGMQLPGAKGTYWGALNAVTEFVDHHQPSKGGLPFALLGGGMSFKQRAARLILEASQAL